MINMIDKEKIYDLIDKDDSLTDSEKRKEYLDEIHAAEMKEYYWEENE